MGSSSNNQTRIRRRGFTLVEVLVTIGIIGTVAALLLPALSRGKAKAHRIKCLNNLSTIGKALTIYGHSFDGRLPWQILDDQQREQLGSSWSDFTMSPAAIFSLPPMVREIGNAKVLLSPCDPGRLPYNEEAQQMWDTLDPSRNIILPGNAISYLLIEGADLGRPTTVMAITRNVSDCDLRKARWVGSDEENLSDTPQAMAGLTRGKGQLVMADSSAHLSNDADLGKQGMVIRAHVESAGGNSIKEASPIALGGCGEYKEVPLPEVFNTKLGNHHTFIIDKSGSMRSDDRMNQAQNALLAALGDMRPTKKFYVFFFSSGEHQSMGGEPRFAFQYEVDLVRPWIEKQRASGSTDPRGAIRETFERIHPDTIWILTDGWFNGKGGSTAVRKLIRELNTDRLVRVNTVGFGRDPKNVDRNLGGIAADNNGTYFFSRSDIPRNDNRN
jgi:prepilin-type N-terminal cleavage/methylation domain-containing protein